MAAEIQMLNGFLLEYIAAVVGVFAVGTAVEYLRKKTVQNSFMKWVANKYSDRFEKANRWFNFSESS